MTILILAGANTALDVQNTTNAASNQVAIFRAGNRTPGQGNDEGYFSFYADDSARNSVEFARLRWIANSVSTSSKYAEIGFSVQSNNTLKEVLRLVAAGLVLRADENTDEDIYDNTNPKKLSIQRRTSAPSNAAYIKFTNPSGANQFYFVLEGG